MTATPETLARETSAKALGGLADASGGIATVVLAICGLVNIVPTVMIGVAIVVFGAALLIQGAAITAEYARVAEADSAPIATEPGADSAAAVFIIGAAGIVLGILSLLRIDENVIAPVAIISFGAAMLLGSNGVWQLKQLGLARQGGAVRPHLTGADVLESEVASGSAVAQSLSGLAAIVLGILALSGLHDPTLVLVALLQLGGTLLVTGGALTATGMVASRR
ncbi:MAG TPA: hypothetical protein VIF34_08025 [Methylocystis sp.]|jgi:hypothetical protein